MFMLNVFSKIPIRTVLTCALRWCQQWQCALSLQAFADHGADGAAAGRVAAAGCGRGGSSQPVRSAIASARPTLEPHFQGASRANRFSQLAHELQLRNLKCTRSM